MYSSILKEFFLEIFLEGVALIFVAVIVFEIYNKPLQMHL